MIKPIVNQVMEEGGLSGLAVWVAIAAAIYAAGALSTLGYTQIMVRAAQKILSDIRRDLFAHLQTLPLRFFDSQRKGDLMILFTNDVDTISDALNNSFAMPDPEFYPGRRHADSPLSPQLAPLPDRGSGLWRDVPLYPLQQPTEQIRVQTAAGISGRAGRLHRGDGGRTEGGQGLSA